jgi:K+-transporting ATPase c subunit
MIRTSLLMTFYLTVCLPALHTRFLMTGIGMLFLFGTRPPGVLIVRGRPYRSVLVCDRPGILRPAILLGPAPQQRLLPLQCRFVSGSNYGPQNPDLKKKPSKYGAKRCRESIRTTKQASRLICLTSSGSGLDPHISLASAEIPGSAHRTPALAPTSPPLHSLITANIQTRQLGFLGDPVGECPDAEPCP